MERVLCRALRLTSHLPSLERSASGSIAVVEPLCDRLSVVAFEGRVENDVMQLFRRGDQVGDA